MGRVKRTLAPDLQAQVTESGVAWLIDFAAEIMATLTDDELDALAEGGLRPSEDALRRALSREETADDDDEADEFMADEVHDEECSIVRFLHCAQCLNERPDGQSPREWARLAVGTTADYRLVIWCVRHEREVFALSGTPPVSGSA